MSYERSYRSYAIEPTERFLFAGDIGGRLRVVDIDTFAVIDEVQAHAGVIERVEMHPTLPYLATLCADQSIGVWRVDGEKLTRLHDINLRRIPPENADEYTFLQTPHSESLALGFHPTRRSFVSRNATGAPMEIVFDDETWETSWCRGYLCSGWMTETISIGYMPDGRIRMTTNRGEMRVFHPSRRADPDFLFTSETGQSLHEPCHLGGLVYLVPTDARHVLRFDFSGTPTTLIGPNIARDDVETVFRCATTNRTFATSFDRNVYEIDPETCEKKGVVLRTPFKLRWHGCLARDPSTMIVQCRNGSLYKANLDTKTVTAVLREGPNALWSSVALPGGDVVVAGEGSSILRLTPRGKDSATQTACYEAKWESTGAQAGAYTKRAAYHLPTNTVYFGRTDGEIRALGPKGERRVMDLGSPVRDLAVTEAGHIGFAVTEDGTAHRIDLETGQVCATFHGPSDEPLWALAYNPVRKLLAVVERYGSITMLDSTTMAVANEMKGAPRAKRMRWISDDALVFGRSTVLYKLDVRTGECTSLIEEHLNTIEDFAWDAQRKYFAAIGYQREISIFDFETFAHLHTTTFDMDYPKGLLWLNDPTSGHPYELLVHGRSGVVRRYLVHNNVLVPAGPLNEASVASKTAGVTVP